MSRIRTSSSPPSGSSDSAMPVIVRPATPSRWKDVEKLFGPRGACAGCWCMFWRVTRTAYENGKHSGNKRKMKALVASGAVPGLIAYRNGEPVGWCAVAPRSEYTALSRSRVLAPVDDKPVWSVSCFFVARGHRRTGVTVELLKAAVEYARKKKANIVEGYPVEPKKGAMADVFVWTGLASAFRKAGFKEAARRSATRPIMRYEL